MGRQVTFTKEQRELAKRNEEGRLFAIAWEQNGNSVTLTGPCGEKEFRYVKRALAHLHKLAESRGEL
jgi:hypothetical protein